ncbi:MAG: hypothetical protein ABJA67_13860 [Chthonomonadales bacterium]
MKTQSVIVALTIVNLALFAHQFFGQVQKAHAETAAPMLRGSGLEIVDDKGRVRAMIKVFPATTGKMPDGSTGYPETVLLRLIDSKGGPNVKIAATDDGSAVSLVGESNPTVVQILARGKSTSIKLANKDGRQHVVKP